LSVAGLGYEISKWLAILGADVVIACRSEERANEARTCIYHHSSLSTKHN